LERFEKKKEKKEKNALQIQKNSAGTCPLVQCHVSLEHRHREFQNLTERNC